MLPFYHDLRYAVRALVKSPAFTILVILTLALGIGANTAIFSIVHGVVLRPLPFPDAERLVRICEVHEKASDFCVVSPPDAEDWSRQTRTLEEVGIGRGWPMVMKAPEGVEGVSGALASAGFLKTFRAEAVSGRLFLPEDYEKGRPPVVILTYRFWQSRFGGEPGILGRTLTLDGESHTVIGILAAGLEIPELERARLWVPLPFDPRDEENRDWRGFQAIARLGPGVTLEEARSEMTALGARLAERFPASHEGWRATVVPLHERVVGGIRPILLMFFGAVTFVLLIGCTNVANMLLARSLTRHRELAVRASFGAGRGRLVRQLLTESLVLAIAGGVVGLVLAWWSVKAFQVLAPSDIPRLDEIGINGTVLVFTVLVSIVASMLFGLMPARRAARLDLMQALRASGSTRTPSSAARGALVVAEVALALMLLIGAGLLIRSFVEASRWQGGFDHENLLTMWLLPPEDKYVEEAQIADLYQRSVEELQALPAVVAAGAASAGPLFGGRETKEFFLDDRPAQPVVARWFDVDTHYFRTMGIPLLQGRYFTAADHADAQRVAIVNEAMARRLELGRDPTGKRVSKGGDPKISILIVGVVGDVEPLAPNSTVEPEIYWPNQQAPRWATFLVVRTDLDPALMVKPVRERLREIEPDMEVGSIATFDELIDQRLVRPRFHMTLLGVFAFVALTLTIGGTYGVISHSVSTRTQEMGLRMSLGAGRREIVALVVGQGFKLVAAGVAIGLVGAFVLTEVLSNMLFGIASTDPVTFGVMAVLLVFVALLAAYVPARRAAGIDPMVAMRCE